jgi:hypothetical protein
MSLSWRAISCLSSSERLSIEQLLAKQTEFVWTGEPLRALEALERLGTPEARAVAEMLVKEAPGTRLADEARRMLDRVK